MIAKLWAFCKEKKEILLYLIFGGLTTVVSLGTFWLFDHVMGIDVLWANEIGRAHV